MVRFTRALRALPAVVAVACTLGGGLTDDNQFPQASSDAKDDASAPTTDSGSPMEICPAEGFEITDCEPVTIPSELLATASPTGRVDVDHLDVELDDCWEWTALATPNGSEIEIEYVPVDASTPCASTCARDLSYWLQLPAGTWTISAQGDSVEVDIY